MKSITSAGLYFRPWSPDWEDPRWAYGYGYHAQRLQGRLRDGFEELLAGEDEDLSDCRWSGYASYDVPYRVGSGAMMVAQIIAFARGGCLKADRKETK